MNLTNEDVQEILRLLENSSFDELSLQTERFKLTLRRAGSEPSSWTKEQQTLSNPNISAAEQAVAPTGPSEQTAAQYTSPIQDGLVNVPAPLVGTFYRAPKPGAAPFVEIGSSVEENTVIGIIEVMKLMNSVPAGVSGEIVELCVQDGAFVERGATLMRIKP
jgi:acetyl-CoA carboxylase biotin carboxyl carrier protein